MSVKPADKFTRNIVLDILSRFVSDGAWTEYTWDDKLLGKLRDEVYEKYEPSSVHSQELYGELVKRTDIKMKDQHRFVFLRPIEDKNMLPLLTLHTSHEWLHFRIYALLTTLDTEHNLQALAIRFETDEGVGGGSHDFCHAQLCKSVNRHIREVTSAWIPDSQLAIPLDADDQVSLVLCMLTSLYGGAYVRGKFSPSGDRRLWKYLDNVRALSTKSK